MGIFNNDRNRLLRMLEQHAEISQQQVETSRMHAEVMEKLSENLRIAHEDRMEAIRSTIDSQKYVHHLVRAISEGGSKALDLIQPRAKAAEGEEKVFWDELLDAIMTIVSATQNRPTEAEQDGRD